MERPAVNNTTGNNLIVILRSRPFAFETYQVAGGAACRPYPLYGVILSEYLSREDERQWRDRIHPWVFPKKSAGTWHISSARRWHTCKASGSLTAICTLITFLLTKDDPLFIKVSAGLIGTNVQPAPPQKCLAQARHSYNSVARLRWDELETRLRPAPVVSELHFPVTVADDALFSLKTAHSPSTACRPLSTRACSTRPTTGHCSDNGITLSAEGRPLAQRRLLGQIARRSWKTVRISCLCFDLLKRLLRDNPATRLSIRDALAHPVVEEPQASVPRCVDVDSKARLLSASYSFQEWHAALGLTNKVIETVVLSSHIREQVQPRAKPQHSV
ncbi:hypothetical protein B0H13DRAFT_2471200 [Mycena leptocephala]|nr:hypothetical protein B0H13DRAFT_2471200 [Mycena leptocephala]